MTEVCSGVLLNEQDSAEHTVNITALETIRLFRLYYIIIFRMN